MTHELGNAGGDGVGGQQAVTGSHDDGVRVRVLGGSPNRPENGSGSDLPLLQYAFPVCIFVPVRRVSAHCGLFGSVKLCEASLRTPGYELSSATVMFNNGEDCRLYSSTCRLDVTCMSSLF